LPQSQSRLATDESKLEDCPDPIKVEEFEQEQASFTGHDRSLRTLGDRREFLKEVELETAETDGTEEVETLQQENGEDEGSESSDLSELEESIEGGDSITIERDASIEQDGVEESEESRGMSETATSEGQLRFPSVSRR
jgi:hypothetical protein